MPQRIRVKWSRVAAALCFVTTGVLAAALQRGERSYAELREEHSATKAELALMREQAAIITARRDLAEVRLNRLIQGSAFQAMGHDLEGLRRESAENRGERRALQVEAADLREDLAAARLDLAQRDLRETEQRRAAQAAGNICGGDLLPPPLEATVVSVRSDIGPLRVQLSVGSDDGVELGVQFVIRRGDTPLARVVTERAARASSAARVFYMADGQCIVEGDTAIRVQ